MRCTLFSAMIVGPLTLTPASPTDAGNWPGWRGPRGCGSTNETYLPLTWDGKTGEGVLWKTPLDGEVDFSSDELKLLDDILAIELEHLGACSQRKVLAQIRRRNLRLTRGLIATRWRRRFPHEGNLSHVHSPPYRILDCRPTGALAPRAPGGGAYLTWPVDVPAPTHPGGSASRTRSGRIDIAPGRAAVRNQVRRQGRSGGFRARNGLESAANRANSMAHLEEFLA